MRRPNFFIVGAPKCGTSSMYYYLLQHPDIFLPHSPHVSTLVQDPLVLGFEALLEAQQLKEPHYFGSDLHFAPRHRTATTLDQYLKLFEGASDEKRVGEASVWYLASTSAAAEIQEFEPTARIIIMLRNPVEVMFRLHGQLCVNGMESIADFEAALAAEPGRIEDPTSVPREPDLLEALFYRRSVSFTQQVQRYVERFGREQTHVIIFDDLKADSAKVYRDTLTFLEVDEGFTPLLPRVNPMSRVRSVWLQRLISHPPPTLLAAFRAMVPRPARQWLFSRFFRYNVRHGARPRLDPSVRKQLQADLSDEVHRLSDLLGRDLSPWAAATMSEGS
jgi:hypothetical protein